jgi:hypothetical protein
VEEALIKPIPKQDETSDPWRTRPSRSYYWRSHMLQNGEISLRRIDHGVFPFTLILTVINHKNSLVLTASFSTSNSPATCPPPKPSPFSRSSVWPPARPQLASAHTSPSDLPRHGSERLPQPLSSRTPQARRRTAWPYGRAWALAEAT